MRKSIFLTLVLSLCMAEFSANAAVAQRGNARGTNNANTNTATQSVTTNNAGAPVSARAGTRQKVVNNGAKTTAAATGNVSARAGKKQTVVNNGVKTSGQPMAARAGATQKVINTGTKVASASENTTVPEECQDAYYGCMDAFCMLDNASGGRCQCNDRITELDKVLEDILKLDEQSYVMATEGVERIQMGEAEEEIMKRAKAAGEKAANANKEAEENKKKARTLDLSVFDNNIFSELDDDIFNTQSAQQSLLDKKGTALFNETSKLCSAQIPQQCKSYGSMLSLVYAQKIKSDCMAYENSLKAQKNQSQQKLQTAQKALRDAALDEYKNQNKYATTGECVIAFTECMKTTAECGDDYTGCVTLAARENMKNTKAGSNKAKQTRIKGQVSGADITLAASTMESLLAKKVICERVTKQCVNSNKNDAVWNGFLRNAAPALKSAELIAEQNLRSNCIPTAAKCFTEACKSQFADNDESYDMCLSNPATYKNLCKVQLEPCLEATGGSFEKPENSSMWNGLIAMLSSMKVDACTKEIKDCLTERCGSDYAGCIGLDTESIGDLCPYQKLTACMSADAKTGKYTDNIEKREQEIRDYVAQIAQGLAVQIDNALATACQAAASEAMIKACGDTESCDNVTFDLSSLESEMKVEILDNTGMHYSNMAMLPADNSLLRGLQLYTNLVGAPNVGIITFDYNTAPSVSKKGLSGQVDTTSQNNIGTLEFITKASNSSTKVTNEQLKASNDVVVILNNALNSMISQINSDPKVVYCREGRKVQGFGGLKTGEDGETTKINDIDSTTNARFPNLTNEYKSVIANALLGKLSEKNLELISKFDEQIAKINNEITERIYAGDEKKIDEDNQAKCNENIVSDPNRYRKLDTEWWRIFTEGLPNATSTERLAKDGIRQLTDKGASYDVETNVCTVKTIKFECSKWQFGIPKGHCKVFDNGTVIDTKTIQMAKSH